MYLHSDDNVENYPNWLTGESNIPRGGKKSHHIGETIMDLRKRSIKGQDDRLQSPVEDSGEKDIAGDSDDSPTDQAQNSRAKFDEIARMRIMRPHSQHPFNVASDQQPLPTGPKKEEPQAGRSDAPVVMLVVDKGEGIVDAFYFFFYSFNLGNKVLNIRFGNHVGDWEHSLIRFKDGVPKSMFFSQHATGAAYTWDAVEKIGKRVSLTSINYRLMKLTFLDSLWLIQRRGRMQCIHLQVYTNSSCPGVSFSIPPIEVPYGIPSSIFNPTRTTCKTTFCEVPR